MVCSEVVARSPRMRGLFAAEVVPVAESPALAFAGLARPRGILLMNALALPHE